MPTIEDFLVECLAQKGDRYIFGAEADAADPDPHAFDCSELVQWAAGRIGLTPTMPDGAYYQWRHTIKAGLALPIAQAIGTRGALLFVGDGTGVGRAAIVHVAVALGDGTTIEARGTKWGIGTWPAAGRFNFAGLIPGLDYAAPAPLPTPAAPANSGQRILRLEQPMMRGDDVRQLQQILTGAGLFRSRDVDGIFGPRTDKATKALQRRLGVPADGEVGPITRQAIDRLLAYVARAH